MQRQGKWFATSILGPDELANKTWAPDADARVIHAKRVGTEITACGRATSNWHKHWSPFDPNSTDNRCSDCSVAVIEDLQSVRQLSPPPVPSHW